MSNVIVRRARNTDDLLRIASCIYLTDPFIYPAAFGTDIDQATCAMLKLMGIENGLFHPDNLALALHGEDICGILLYNKDGAVWDRVQCADLVQGTVPSNENFDYVSEVYFSVESVTPPEDHIEVIACCVMPEFRNMGVGKRMLDWLVSEYFEYTLTLDVLANNSSAIGLYQKCGFKITEELKGFSLEESTRPDCYRMVRYGHLSERSTQR